VTAHNMNNIQLSEQVVESTEAAASVADEKTLVIEETEAVSEEIDASETTEKKATEKSEE